MPTPDTQTQPDDLIDAIVANLTAAFPALRVEAYRTDRRDMALPACMIALVDMEPSPPDDPGTTQLAVLARIEAHVILGFRTTDAMREAPKAAAAVARHVHQQRFGLPIGAAVVTMIEPDEFAPELDQYEVWRVDWQHIIHLGASVWDNDGTIPTEVLASFAPHIGPDHESEYVPIAEVQA